MFVLHAARRNVWLCVGVGVVVAMLGVVVASAIPTVYQASSKIYLTQNSAVTVSLASGRREDLSAGLRGLREAVFNQDNIRKLVVDSQVAENWAATRTWPLRLKDRLVQSLVGKPSVEDVRRALEEVVSQSLAVNTEDASSLRFTAQWRDPQGALKLTQLAQSNYLATRAGEDTEAVRRAVALLEQQVQAADEALVPAISEVQRVVAKVKAEGGARTQAAATAAAAAQAAATAAQGTRSSSRQRVVEADAGAPLPRVSIAALNEKLTDNRRAQKEILDSWQRHSATLKQQLAELRVTFGPEHPNVRQQEAKIQAASEEPSEVAQLKNEEEELMADLKETEVGPGEPTSRPRSYTPRRAGAAAEAISSIRDLDEDKAEAPEVVTARIRLDAALSNSDSLTARLHSARMELVTAQASAKFRYSVVEDAQLPRRPVKPNRALLYLIALLAAVAIGGLSGAVRELLGGDIMEAWQVRRLGVDVLSEVDVSDFRR